MVISVSGSSTRRRTAAITYPTATPMATPPMPVSRNFGPASTSEKLPVTTAATANL